MAGRWRIPSRCCGGLDRTHGYANTLMTMTPATAVMLLVATVVASIAMVFLVTRNILAVIPAVPHKVDPLAAGVVFVAVFAPVPGMARGHMQIDWRAVHRDALDDARFPVDQPGRRIATDIDLTIEAGLSDADRHADVGRECRNGGGGQYGCEELIFHVGFPVVSGSCLMRAGEPRPIVATIRF